MGGLTARVLHHAGERDREIRGRACQQAGRRRRVLDVAPLVFFSVAFKERCDDGSQNADLASEIVPVQWFAGTAGWPRQGRWVSS